MNDDDIAAPTQDNASEVTSESNSSVEESVNSESSFPDLAEAIVNHPASFGVTALAQPKFGEHVRRWRKSVKTSMVNAANECGFSLATLSRMESGNDVRLSAVVRVLAWAIQKGAIGPRGG